MKRRCPRCLAAVFTSHREVRRQRSLYLGVLEYLARLGVLGVLFATARFVYLGVFRLVARFCILGDLKWLARFAGLVILSEWLACGAWVSP